MRRGTAPDCHSTVALHLTIDGETSGPNGRGHHAQRAGRGAATTTARAAGKGGGEMLRGPAPGPGGERGVASWD